MRCRAVAHLRAVGCRSLAVVAALFTVMAVMFAPQAMAADSSADYDTWADVAAAMDKQLQQGQKEYEDGNTAGSTSDFMAAYNEIYVASNFTQVVTDNIGSDKQASQQQAFQDIQDLSYVTGNEVKIEQSVTALVSDLDSTAKQLDANTKLANPRDYDKALQEQIAKERKVLQSKQKKNPGKGDRSWTDVANEMMPILDKAYKSYAGGDGAKGATLVNDAYYQYYEKLGFEKNVMNAISGDRVSQVEYQFKMCRKSMNTGASLKDTKKLVDDLKAMLGEDAGKLDGGAADKEGNFTKFITSSVGQAFLILIREGLEALLVVAAVVAYLVKSGNKRVAKLIYLGLVAGLAGSGLVAVLFTFLFGGSGPIQEISEGVCALIATLMLLWTSNWMLNKSSVEAWNNYIRNKTEAVVAGAQSKVESGQGLGLGMVTSLAMLSFLAVFREGAETVIFYESIYSMSQDAHGMWVGGLTAAAVLIVIFLILRFTSVKIPIGPFFLVTSIVMAALVVIFAGGGIHALIEGDLIEGTYLSIVPTNDWIGLYPYVETIAAQVIAAIAVVALFVVGFIKKHRMKLAAQAEQAK